MYIYIYRERDIYIYIYMYRERDVYIYIYIYRERDVCIYIYREREMCILGGTRTGSTVPGDGTLVSNQE